MATTFKDKDMENPVEVHKLSTKQEMAEDVREATELEHKLTFFQAVKLYPKAIGWSMYFSLGVIMLGKPHRISNARVV
jgi:SP family general alpha glucoside:H+ symporter-like MFS transporter